MTGSRQVGSGGGPHGRTPGGRFGRENPAAPRAAAGAAGGPDARFRVRLRSARRPPPVPARMFAPPAPAADAPAAAPLPARLEARVRRHGRRRAAVQTVRVARRIDRIFAILLTLQWGVAVYLALWFAPADWHVPRDGVHPNVYAAALLGGLVNLVPVCLALRFEGRTVTRHAVAAAQMFYSGLLIHVTGGRIETHFHVFCSLAFLAAYRDWAVLVVPTLLVAADHAVRGRWWPESIYGTADPAPWRGLEHVGWVLFEDAVLVWGCVRGTKELRHMAELTVRERVALRAAAAGADAERDAARDADRQKSEFLANMSHEIRTPLNAILGFADVLRAGDCTPAERRDHLDVIHGSGKHLLALINDILDLSKVEAGRMEFSRRPCDPQAVLADVLSTLRVRAAEKGLTLESRWVGPAPAAVTTDPDRLRQVLINLVGNALKFTEEGSVRLLAEVVPAGPGDRGGDDGEPRGPRFAVEVHDTGEGIPADKLGLVFDPFRQADASVTRRHGGTGLGLAISRRIAAELGGGLTATSRPGWGSVFRLEVDAGDLSAADWADAARRPGEAVRPDPLGPAVADAPAFAEARRETRPPAGDAGEPADRPPEQAPRRFPHARVLLVDDGDVNRRLFRTVLAKAGVVPVEATNGLDGGDLALRAAADGEPFDLILMDMQMPVMDGYAAAARLRDANLTTAAGEPTPVVALTAHAMSGDRARCLEAGCTEYLSKPVRPAELLALAANLLPDAPPAAAPVDEEVNGAGEEDGAAPPARPPGCRLDEPDLWEVAADFAAELPARAAELRRLLGAGDGAGLRDAAHRWKGAAGTLGYPQFDAPAAALEAAPEAAAPDELAALVDDLSALVAEISAAAASADAADGPAEEPAAAGPNCARVDSNHRPSV